MQLSVWFGLALELGGGGGRRDIATIGSKRKLVGLEAGRDIIKNKRIVVNADSRNTTSRISIL
jgi:hypothetical protein